QVTFEPPMPSKSRLSLLRPNVTCFIPRQSLKRDSSLTKREPPQSPNVTYMTPKANIKSRLA
ncbi:hypothetical protein PIB30_053714, partial [Stylosanthes scabra]|nr:hypothetical protein [Stylosanthes scabra]